MRDNDDEILLALRERARRMVHIAFSALALGCLSAALMLHHGGAALGFTGPDTREIANAFLCLGAGHALTLYVWDWLFWDEPAEE